MSVCLTARRWFADFAPPARANGFSCFPVLPGTKQPAVRAWSKYCEVPAGSAEFEKWLRTLPNHSVALACGEILAVDIDLSNLAKAQAARALVEQKLGPTPLMRVGAPPKIAMLYRADFAIRNAKIGAIDLLAKGRCLIAHGVHPSGREYEWLKASPSDVLLRDLPIANAMGVDDLSEALSRMQDLSFSPTLARHRDLGNQSHDGPTRHPRTGLVVDGRDQHLSELVWIGYRRGYATAREIADEAWEAFIRTTDLARPKRDGGEAWRYDDALEKARYVLASSKPRIAAAAPHAPFWTPERKRGLASFVAHYVAVQCLPRTLVAASDAMLGFLHGNDVCAASIETLAKLSHLGTDRFKAVRRQLVRHRLWSPSNNLGGAYKTAEYTPVRDCLNADPRKPRP